jgi:hypothetical protein
MSPEEIQEFIDAAQRAGISVRDERTRPAGQRVWDGPHLHLSVPEHWHDPGTMRDADMRTFSGDREREAPAPQPRETPLLDRNLRMRIGNEWAELVTSNGVVIGLHPADATATVKPGTVGAINIEFQAASDLESAIRLLKSHGVTFVTEIQEYEHVSLITCADPDGNRMFLGQPLARS